MHLLDDLAISGMSFLTKGKPTELLSSLGIWDKMFGLRPGTLCPLINEASGLSEASWWMVGRFHLQLSPEEQVPGLASWNLWVRNRRA